MSWDFAVVDLGGSRSTPSLDADGDERNGIVQ